MVGLGEKLWPMHERLSMSNFAVNPNVPYSARDDYDERTPSERGYDDAWDNQGYGHSASTHWSEGQYNQYYEAFDRGLENREDAKTFGGWDDDLL